MRKELFLYQVKPGTKVYSTSMGVKPSYVVLDSDSYHLKDIDGYMPVVYPDVGYIARLPRLRVVWVEIPEHRTGNDRRKDKNMRKPVKLGYLMPGSEFYYDQDEKYTNPASVVNSMSYPLEYFVDKSYVISPLGWLSVESKDRIVWVDCDDRRSGNDRRKDKN